MQTTQTILDQLVRTYFDEEIWMKHKMNFEQAYDYHLKQLEKGSIRVIQELGVLLGYYQLFKVTNEQANRILQGLPFDENSEDITHGDIALLHNLWIDKSFRQGETFKRLKKMFFADIKGCKTIVGVEQKYRERIKLFNLRS
jgi:hypothetical protein